MSEYKNLQIIKHALQHYIQRPNATKKELLEEKKLLDKVTVDVETLQEKYGIGRKERA
ncbi:hypothetical protein [Cytobacillus oceanisediminis]|uniref:hypothetical protein n=1 Tax=Cytobacillus oceanisediminis TaxID=665099 RepID=UPI00207A1662|nr:hypothetical protein [Cytobacillus oceanisediminis]USK43747.1 hypothetical protein LIT27_24735 [Cytobacillus oceanisediminis]